MIIIVETKLKFWNPELDRYIITDQNELWKFNFQDGKLYSMNNTWVVPCNDLEEAFKKIQGYFSGTNYVITDLQPGVN